MFFTEVHLSRDHWSFRLLNFVFPQINRFNNFCPHFWLSLLAALLLPFVLLLKWFVHIAKIIAIPFIHVSKSIDAALEKRKSTAFERLTRDQQLLGTFVSVNYNILYNIPTCERRKLHRYEDLYNCYRGEKQIKFDIIDRWFEKHSSTPSTPYTPDELAARALLDKFRVVQTEKPKFSINERFVQVKAEHKSSLAVLMWIAKYIAAPIIGVIVVLLALICTYCVVLALGWVGYWVVYFFTHINIVPMISVLLYIGSVIVFIFGGLFLINIIIKYSAATSSSVEKCEEKRRFFRKLCSPFMYIGKGTVSIVEFL